MGVEKLIINGYDVCNLIKSTEEDLKPPSGAYSELWLLLSPPAGRRWMLVQVDEYLL